MNTRDAFSIEGVDFFACYSGACEKKGGLTAAVSFMFQFRMCTGCTAVSSDFPPSTYPHFPHG